MPSRINSTWGGNLTDMVRATMYLQIIHEDRLVENAATVGEYLLGKLVDVQGKFPGLVSNARGCGLMAAFDLPDGDTRGATLLAAKENGLLVVGCGERTVRFRPPLNLTKEEVDEGIDIVERSLSQIA